MFQKEDTFLCYFAGLDVQSYSSEPEHMAAEGCSCCGDVVIQDFQCTQRCVFMQQSSVIKEPQLLFVLF